jgi:hypothetical protein
MSWPFNNPSSWADKVEVHNNERKTSTYFNQARIAEQLESTGRFAEQARPSITGETPAVLYPRLPRIVTMEWKRRCRTVGAPWRRDRPTRTSRHSDRD